MNQSHCVERQQKGLAIVVYAVHTGSRTQLTLDLWKCKPAALEKFGRN